MKTIWTDHIKDPNEKVQFEKSLLHSRWILDQQTNILDKRERGLENQELSPKAFDTPNWDYRQAYANGYKACIRWVKQLNNLDHKDDRIISNDRATLGTTD